MRDATVGRFFLSLTLFFLGAVGDSLLHADEIRLKDGRVVEGKIVAASPRVITIEKRDGEKITFHAAEIASIVKGATSWELRERNLKWYEQQVGRIREQWGSQVSFAKQCGQRKLEDKRILHLRKAYELRKAETSDEDATAHYDLGVWCERLQMDTEAEAEYRRAWKLAPKNARARTALERFLQKRAEGLKHFGYYERESRQDEENTEIIGPGTLEYGLAWVENSILNRKGRGEKPYQLYPDWQKRLGDACRSLRSRIESGKVLGFTLGDELVWHGLPVEAVHRVSDFLRARFPDPGVIIYYNEGGTPVLRGRDMFRKQFTFSLPASMSWFSIDWYRGGNKDPDFVNKVRKAYENKIYTIMHPHQKAVLIPGCFGTKDAWSDERIARDAWDYYTWALEDLRVVAIFPWGRVSYGGVDLGKLPKASKAWREVGMRIKTGKVVEERVKLLMEKE